MRQIDEHGVGVLMAARIARWRARGVHLHLSFDVDFLDPGVAPGPGPWCRAARPIARRI